MDWADRQILELREQVELLLPNEKPGLPPFARNSSTSRAAALEAAPKAETRRHQVLTAVRFRDHEGLTRDGIAGVTGLPDSSVDPRVDELIKGGWLIQTDRKRKTRAGKLANILIPSAKTYDQFGRP